MKNKKIKIQSSEITLFDINEYTDLPTGYVVSNGADTALVCKNRCYTGQGDFKYFLAPKKGNIFWETKFDSLSCYDMRDVLDRDISQIPAPEDFKGEE